ncbi:unnamed protein product [Closterium sp. Yama58-4]|nr:unnamed protein product [Closterium sp. Yama58-4]
MVAKARLVAWVAAATWFATGWKDRVLKLVAAAHPEDKPVLVNVSKLLTMLLRVAAVGTLAEMLGFSLKSLIAVGGISGGCFVQSIPLSYDVSGLRSHRLGVALGFASKEIVTNFFGGLILFLTQPFVVGDKIKAGSVTGRVREIGFLQTKLEADDNSPIVVPNYIFNTALPRLTALTAISCLASHGSPYCHPSCSLCPPFLPFPPCHPSLRASPHTNPTCAHTNPTHLLALLFLPAPSPPPPTAPTRGSQTTSAQGATFVLRNEDIIRIRPITEKLSVCLPPPTHTNPFAPLTPPLLPHQIVTNYTRAGCLALEATFVLRNEDIIRIRPITEKLTAYLRAHPLVDVSKGPTLGYLKKLSGTGLEVGIICYVQDMEDDEYLAVQQEILEQSAEIIGWVAAGDSGPECGDHRLGVPKLALLFNPSKTSPSLLTPSPPLFTTLHPCVQEDDEYLAVQQEILEQSAEIIVEEGAYLGESAPFEPSASLVA